MGYTRFNSRSAMAHVGAKALEALDGLVFRNLDQNDDLVQIAV